MITLAGSTPHVLTLATGQTPAQLIQSAQAQILAGQVTGNLSGIGKDQLIGVFDNADAGLTSLGGVTLGPTDIFLAQFKPGNITLSGTVNSDDYNCFVAGLTGNWTNAANAALGAITNQPTVTATDWIIFLLGYQLQAKP